MIVYCKQYVPSFFLVVVVVVVGVVVEVNCKKSGYLFTSCSERYPPWFDFCNSLTLHHEQILCSPQLFHN
jgi:hypothetical protein